jgi:hypothetical protein
MPTSAIVSQKRQFESALRLGSTSFQEVAYEQLENLYIKAY